MALKEKKRKKIIEVSKAKARSFRCLKPFKIA